MEKLWFFCKRRLNHLLKDEQGSALVFSLFILIMLGIWGGATLTLSTNEYYISNNSLKGIQSYYLAEAGLEEALVNIKNNPTSFENYTNTLETGNYKVTYEQNSENNIVKITSLGQAKEGKKELNAKVEINKTLTEENEAVYEVKLIDWW
ncbi:hypothetical protein SAMN00017405_0264 [Desulfonispora thiosulfatigenes DSM 11270]|uniref:PilX N-terminal n=1 Tax=Desulfonispora thiosulfatigenes DSM 11270 TaxID=656914 RepID=A0A1W1VMZ8_DESTI|nr:pilus assembly PilX N-terminal domain-containing protein [Desulfonispora thiosulfatigenes]SMB94739.1 hypothetical protein SAMN00017405_0264 [Desulfonispora thiosulfatigenes DSM 11270]